MASQGLLFKAWAAVGSVRGLLGASNYRVAQNIPQALGMKHSASEKLKELQLPEKPAKPMTPYIRFIMDHQKEVKTQHPSWKMTEVNKQCGADWKELEEKVREKYQKEYKEKMEVYAKKYMQYMEKLTDEQKQAINDVKEEVKKNKKKRETRKREKESHKPKRPVSGYMLYIMEQCKLKDKSFKDGLSEFKNNWAAMSDSAKQQYLDKAAAAKATYDKELLEWEKQMISDGNTDLVRSATLSNTTYTFGPEKKEPRQKATPKAAPRKVPNSP